MCMTAVVTTDKHDPSKRLRHQQQGVLATGTDKVGIV